MQSTGAPGDIAALIQQVSTITGGLGQLAAAVQAIGLAVQAGQGTLVHGQAQGLKGPRDFF